jgi:hypothetical protein
MLALYSCVFAFRRLTRPGMSQEVRFVFIRKHIIYVFSFVFLWSFSLSHIYFQIYSFAQRPNSEDKIELEGIDETMKFISTFTSMFTGVIMSGVRVSEPYMRFLIVKWWKELFGVLMDERDINDKQVYANDSLATFLTSSLNVELVHVILEAITKFTTSYEDPSITHKDFLK